MNKFFLEAFIAQIESIQISCNPYERVKDERGEYSKSFYLENLVKEAKELIKHGEYKVSLENLLENLYEVSIYLDESVINLAFKAFGNQISPEIVLLINELTIKP